MASLIIPLAGAAVGSFFGPIGSSIGWMLGSAYVSRKNAPQTMAQQQSVGEILLTTANHGTSIPISIGSQRIAGNIIWYGGKQKYTKEQHITSSTSGTGKGRGSFTKSKKATTTVVVTGYTVSFAVAICKGPILGISKVWNGNQLIIDAVNGTKLPGTLYLGDNSQLPNATMEAIEGSGNVPAYRGISYMVMTDYDLGNTPSMPQFSFLVHRPTGVI